MPNIRDLQRQILEAKLAREMTHTTRAPIESLRGQDPLTDWALGMRERTLSPLATLAGEAKRFQGLTPQEMGMELVGGGLAGTVGKAGKTALSDLSGKWESQGVKNDVYERGGKITLSKIIVPKDARNSGIGTQYMQDLMSYADSTGKRVELSPSADFGGNKNKLKEFYSRFGFIENKGKNKDFGTMESMYREPIQSGQAMSVPAKTEFELAHELAQKNASLPIEKGGLGLPDNNTAMDRAKAMGFDTPAYHGTDKNFTEFRPGFAEGQGHGIYTSTNPLDTHEFASSSSGGNTMPLMVNLRNPVRDLTDPLTDEFPINERTKELIRLGFDGSIMKNANNLLGDEVVAFKPNQIRSRFASFDPFNRNSANILAGGAGGAVGLSSLAYPYGDEYQ